HYFIVAQSHGSSWSGVSCGSVFLQTIHPLTVRASIQRNGVEMSADNRRFLQLVYLEITKLRVEGTYDGLLGGIAFVNETYITFSQRSMTIFWYRLTSPLYARTNRICIQIGLGVSTFASKQEAMRFRAIPINTELRAFNDAVDVYMSNLGTVSLEYTCLTNLCLANGLFELENT
ncbi:Protein of unknown function, partial [Gryllus bimaculatus]